MLSCREAAKLLSDAQDGDLTIAERAALEAHVGICTACERLRQQFGDLRDIMRRYRDKR